MSMKVYVLFFRGLNTYGDDHLHLGPHLPIAEMSHFIERAVEPRRLIPVSDMGPGGPESMAERAVSWMKRHPIWNDPKARFHILAHSTGGLAARAFLQVMGSDKVLSIATIATPHHGTPLADGSLALNPKLQKFLKVAGYDVERRKSHFAELRPEAIEIFCEKYPDPKEIPFGSILAAVPYSEMTWISRKLSETGKMQSQLSDGFVPLESQKWGQVIHHAYLEHVEELGLSLRLPGQGRRRFRIEFSSMIDSLLDFWRSHD